MVTKAKIKKTRKTIKTVLSQPEADFATPIIEPMVPQPNLQKHKWSLIAGGIILLLALLLWKNKSWMVVAVVNNQPIFRWELNSVLLGRFGKQTLEGMISEKLVGEAGQKAKIEVSQAEIQVKENQILKSFGGQVKLDDILKFQGMSRVEFDRQIYLQLLVQKILEKDIEITDKEIDDFLTTNQATLTATEPGELRQEARQALLEQKVSAKAQEWFTQLRDQAKIVKFL